MDGVYPQGGVQWRVAMDGHPNRYRRLGDYHLWTHRMAANQERQKRNG